LETISASAISDPVVTATAVGSPSAQFIAAIISELLSTGLMVIDGFVLVPADASVLSTGLSVSTPEPLSAAAQPVETFPP
jgi:hypothetical protein